MAEIIIGDIGQGGLTVGCKDPAASNYNPSALVACTNCCEYNPGGGLPQTFGCLDPAAINYNPNALNQCVGCCQYKPIEQGVLGDIIVTVPDVPIDTKECVGPYSINVDGIVIGVNSAECCSKNNPQLGPSPGFQYYWDGTKCKLVPICPTRTTCINCQNFDWWNDTYILNHNGQSLSTTSPILWQQIVDLVTNSGQTISVNTLNGEPISEECCEGNFSNGLCFCQPAIEEQYEPKCITNLQDFLNLISTTEGNNFFTANFQTIGPSLGLTTQQINYILLNINNNNIDPNSNPSASYATQARLILSNALNTTGGFHVNFGLLTNNPKLMTKPICDQYGGFWDGVNCMCKPVVDQCEIDITQVKVINSFDFFNNPIQLVVLASNGSQLTEACCNRLIKDYNLPWEWQAPFCLAVKKEDCLPIKFTLNDPKKPLEVPVCANNLELSMWVYFSKPENPCQPIPDPPTNDVVVIDGTFCDITLTPNTGVVQTNPENIGVEVLSQILSTQKQVGSPIPVGPVGPTDAVTAIGFSDVNPSPSPASGQTKICCYNTQNPIIAQIGLTDSSLNGSLIQGNTYNSVTNFFNQWVKITATLPTSGQTLNFGVYLEITQGLNCCCNYDIFIDDIRVDCPTSESALIVNDIKCPGFNLTKVIDNKKSWVYNPGLPEIGRSEYDDNEREDGSVGTLNGEGTINRTFAPSLDAEIPWRYTDYWAQSSVYEKHSNLVLNSKELWLTFDMCAKCPISGTTLVCPDGYTLSANTSICYQETVEKLFQDGSYFIFMDGDNYLFQ